MLELKLYQNSDDIQGVDYLIHSLSFEVVFETDLDLFTFKVPYLLNLLLNSQINLLTHDLQGIQEKDEL